MPSAPPDVSAIPHDSVLELLRQRGADTLPHLNGPLLDHLLGTERLLRAWECSEAVALAGLAHAAYGTDGFADHLLDLEERELLREAGGEDVEALVYLYASCDRKATYPQLPGRAPVAFCDRFTDESFQATDEQVSELAALTLANETELFVVATCTPAPEWLFKLFEEVRTRVSPSVRTAAGQVLGAR